jgi:hypothetical protein
MLKDRQTPVHSEISRSMRLSELSTLGFAEIESNGRAGRRTIDGYKDTYNRVISPALSGLRLNELTTGRLDRFLKNVAIDHPATARHSKIVLTGIIGLAVRHEALHSNPIRDVGPKLAKKIVQALSVQDVQQLRTIIGGRRTLPIKDGHGQQISWTCWISSWQQAPASARSLPFVGRTSTFKRTRQPSPAPELSLWKEAAPPTGKTIRRHKPASGQRRCPLAARTLHRRYSADQPKPEDMLFPSSTGTVRSPHNFRRQWRDARAGSAFEWVTPHVFRKSVATLIDQQYSSKHAAAQLGHSGTAITEKHYIAKATESPDLTAALEQFGRSEPYNGPSL